MLPILEISDDFYDAVANALSFVTPTLLQVLPSIHLVLGLLLAAWSLMFLMRIVLTWYPQVDSASGVWALVICRRSRCSRSRDVWCLPLAVWMSHR